MSGCNFLPTAPALALLLLLPCYKYVLFLFFSEKLCKVTIFILITVKSAGQTH
jgi:hypothetical protein